MPNARAIIDPMQWMRTFCVLVALCAPLYSVGFEIQKSDGSAVTHDADITTVTFQGNKYRLWSMPASAEHLEIFSAIPEKYRGDFLRSPAGELVTADEVARFLEAYYRAVAVDFDSMKLRNLEVPGLRYVSICDSFLVQCMSRTVHAGTLVTYEVNGKNREGGMTGFEPQQVLITKIAASEPVESIVPGRIPRATAEQLRSVLSDGYSLAADKPTEQVLNAARAALTQAGFTVAPVDSADPVVFSDPKTLKMTSKQADCGKLYGLTYVGDKRTETTVLLSVSGENGSVRVRAAVNGILRVDTPKLLGGGPADKALTCTSTGALERELANKILAGLQ